MAVNNLNQKLEEVIKGTPSKWEDKSKERVKNRSWLKRSAKIALKIKSTIKAKGISQVQLAGMMQVSPQQISKILKGKENLTLETIDKLEKALNIELITVPSFQESKKITVPAPETRKQTVHYTNVVKAERQKIAYNEYSSTKEVVFTVEKDAA